MAKSKSPVKLVSYEEIMGIADCEEVVMIAIDDINNYRLVGSVKCISSM